MLSKEQKNSPEIFSVSQLNKNAKFTLEKKFNDVWVKGEISEFTNYRQSGHWYFTLKDENSSISCVMFKFKNSYLKNIPEIGDEIVLKGKLFKLHLIIYTQKGMVIYMRHGRNFIY